MERGRDREREGDGTGIAETIINSQFSVSRFPKLEREGDVPGDTSCRLFRARKRRGRDEREREGGDRRMCGGCKCAREMRWVVRALFRRCEFLRKYVCCSYCIWEPSAPITATFSRYYYTYFRKWFFHPRDVKVKLLPGQRADSSLRSARTKKLISLRAH